MMHGLLVFAFWAGIIPAIGAVMAACECKRPHKDGDGR